MLLIHGGDDGVGTADRLVSDDDGLFGLNIGKAVVVDDLGYLHLFQSAHGLGCLVVVNQHDALSLRAKQMEARERTDDLVVLVYYGVASVTAGEQNLLDVVNVVREVEGDQLLGRAHAHNGQRLIDKPR